MGDVIEQMKKIQIRIGSVIDNSNQHYQPASKATEIVGGEGIEVKSDGRKVSISQQQQQQQQQEQQQQEQQQQEQIKLPSGTGVLGINNGVLFVYETTECS
jgi:cation transport ATPase